MRTAPNCRDRAFRLDKIITIGTAGVMTGWLPPLSRLSFGAAAGEALPGKPEDTFLWHGRTISGEN
jgi:hypothetical protein